MKAVILISLLCLTFAAFAVLAYLAGLVVNQRERNREYEDMLRQHRRKLERVWETSDN